MSCRCQKAFPTSIAHEEIGGREVNRALKERRYWEQTGSRRAKGQHVFALGIHSPEMPHRRGGTCLSPSTPVLLYNSHEAFTGTASFLPHNSPDLQVLSGQRSRTDSSLPLAIHWMDSKVGPQRSAFLWCVLRVADYHREGHKVVLEPKRP